MIKLQKGFTLIEILIVISISVIFMVVSYGGFRDFARRQEQTVAKRTIIQDLREAQKNASTGYKPTGCTGTLVGFSFRVTTAANTNPVSYEISAICTNPLGGADVELLLKTNTLTANIYFRTNPNPNPIVFNALGRGTNIAGSTALSVSSRNNPTGVSYDLPVTITQSGEIK